MIQTLQLRYDATAEAKADAWFLAGAEPSHWLEELVRCGLADMETRLFPVPHSVQDRRPVGVLVVPGRTNCKAVPAGAPCRLVAGRLYVPVDAAVSPPLSDVELRSAVALPVSFLHPVFGLSGYETESALRVSDLIAMPHERSENWNSARPGPSSVPELTGLVLLQPPTIEDIFGGAQDDIGSEPLSDLPAAPDEPADTKAADVRRKLREMFAKGVSETMRRMPHTAAKRNWLNDIEDWANRQLRGVSEQLQKVRNKEIHRLLHMLESDPEAGLRHAIPMNDFAHRGIAPPGGRLGERSLDFNPHQLGGHRADFWQIPFDLQEVLRRRYREMADREMQLGRHRRAAYIYAELLGDLVSAANALRQGKLYREAALLYDEHLKNPLEAARCLAEGGLIAEAIERYEKLGRWMEIADLYERIGDQASADRTLRRIVEERLTQDDVVGAAKLLEGRLRAPDEAVAILLDAWPRSSQAVMAVSSAFQLLGRLGKHEVTLDRLTQFRRGPVPDALVSGLIPTLVTAARDYPDGRVKHRAADVSRVLIARQLQRPLHGADDAARFLESLVRLAPEDRILSRDANRYLARRRSADLRVRRVLPPPAQGTKYVEYRRFELPRQIEWLQLRREAHFFFALGVSGPGVSHPNSTSGPKMWVIRGAWDSVAEKEGHPIYLSQSWDCAIERVKSGFTFEPTLDQGRGLAMAFADGNFIELKRFPASDRFYHRETVAGTPVWFPTQSYPVAIGDEVVWAVHLVTGQAVLACYDKVRGTLQRTVEITEDLLKDAERTQETRLCLAAVGSGVAVALGNRLLLSDADGKFTKIEIPGQAVQLYATLPNTRRGVAVMMHIGAVMYWAGSDSWIELDRDVSSPIAAFIPGGPLVLVSGKTLIQLEVDSRGVQNVARTELTGQRPVGVSATANPGEFALLGGRGEMSLYRRPR